MPLQTTLGARLLLATSPMAPTIKNSKSFRRADPRNFYRDDPGSAHRAHSYHFVLRTFLNPTESLIRSD